MPIEKAKPVTVAELIAELQKLPPDRHVWAMTQFGLKPAHAREHVSGDVHVLGHLGTLR